MSEDEDRTEGGKCDQAYDDYVSRITDPELAGPQLMRLCRSCGKTCPDGCMRGHICFECDFMFSGEP